MKNHLTKQSTTKPPLLWGIAGMALSAIFYGIAHRPTNTPSELVSLPTGDIVLKNSEGRIYCSRDGNHGTEFFNNSNILSITFHKKGDLIQGELQYRIPQKAFTLDTLENLQTPQRNRRITVTEGSRLTYAFDSLGTVNMSITTKEQQTFYGLRGNIYTYLQEPIEFSMQRCDHIIKNYTEIVTKPA